MRRSAAGAPKRVDRSIEGELYDPGGGFGAVAGVKARTAAVPALAALVLLCLLLSAIALLGARTSSASHIPQNPNVLFIVSDDQRIGTMDALPRTMARWFLTDEDTKGATEFTNAFVTTPLCCPSRASIFTGRYEHNHGVKNNDGTLLGTSPSSPGQQTTLQYYLHEKRNYRTGIFGKYLNGWGLDDPPPYFDDYSTWDSGIPKAGFLANEPAGKVRVRDYDAAYVEQKALEFLGSANTDPFFLTLTPTLPHEPFEPEPQWANLSVPSFTPPAVSIDGDRANKPFMYQEDLQDPPTITNDVNAQRRMLKSVDVMIDNVLQYLEDEGKLDNTLVFFISDNGYLTGEHGLKAKSKPYMEAVRVPAYLRWPAGGIGSAFSSRIPRVDDRLVAGIDMAATVLDANHVEGSELNQPLDGMPVTDPGATRNRILTEMFGTSPGDVALRFASITTPTYSYTEHFTGGGTTALSEWVDSPHQVPAQDNDSAVVREYYDLRLGADPGQAKNLLRDGNRENDPPVGSLSTRLATDLNCAGTACPGPSNAAPLPIQVQFTSRPDNGSADRTPTFAFTSSQSAATFHCELDGQPIPDQQCQSPYTVPSSAPLSVSQHTFEVTAEYPVGNVGSDTVNWSVGSAPDVRLHLDGSQPRKLSRDPTPSFEFDASQNAVRVECVLTGPEGTITEPNCTSPWTAPNRSDGKHVFTATAVDAVGNEGSAPAYTWWIDTTAPAVSFYFAPFGRIADSTANLGFQVANSASYGSGDGIAGFECSTDGGSFTRCGDRREVQSAPGFTQYTAGLVGLTNATHTVRVRAIDLAGNVGSASSPPFGWENQAVTPTFEDLPDNTWPDIVAGTDGTTDAQVVISDGSGGWFVGGTFNEVRNAAGVETTHTNIVHINSDKTVDEQWNASTDGPVSTMVLSPDQSKLYIGGSFSLVNGTPRDSLAAITTAAPASLVLDWNPTAMRDCTGGSDVAATVTSLALGATPDVIYVGGNFTNISGVPRNKLAALPLTGNGPTLPTIPTAWNPPIDADPANDCIGAEEPVHTVYALAVTPFNKIIAGGDKDLKISGQVRSLAQFDRTTATRDTWWDPRPRPQRALASS